MVRGQTVLFWASLSLFAAFAFPGRAAERTGTPTAGLSAESTSASTPGTPLNPADDYAHVFYQFSATRGFHVFIHTAQGTEREITDEPGWEARHQAALEAHNGARRQDYVQAHPELPSAIRDMILTGGLARGMATEQVRASAGDPVEEHRTLTRNGLLEEWRYGITRPERTGELPLLDAPSVCAEGRVVRKGQTCVLHFLDGRLITWSGSREAMTTPTPKIR